MPHVHFYKLVDGLFTGTEFSGSYADIAPHTRAGWGAIEGVSDWLSQRVDITQEPHVLVDYQPPKPEDTELQTYSWNTESRRWEVQPTLLYYKQKKWTEIKNERTRRETGTITVNNKVFDLNENKLAGAALDALMAKLNNESWSQNWVLADNTVVVLTADEMVTVGRLAKAAISDLWNISQELRAQIDSATSIEAVDAIIWPSQS